MLELGSDVIFHHIVPLLSPLDLQSLRASCQDLYLLIGISKPWQLACKYPLLPGMPHLSDWQHFYKNRAHAGTWISVPGSTTPLEIASSGDKIRDIGLVENYLVILTVEGLLHIYDCNVNADNGGTVQIQTTLLARLGPPSSSVIDMVCGGNTVLVRDSESSVWALVIDDSTISVSDFGYTFDPGAALVRGPLMSTPSPNPEFVSALITPPSSPLNRCSSSSSFASSQCLSTGRTLMTTSHTHTSNGQRAPIHAVVDPQGRYIVLTDGEGLPVKLDYSSGVVTAITSTCIGPMCIIVFSKACGGLYYIEITMDSHYWRSQLPPVRQIFGRYPTCHRLAMTGRRLVGATEFGSVLDLTVGKLGFEEFHEGSFVDVCAGNGTFTALDSQGRVFRWGSTWLSESHELGLGNLLDRPKREGIEYKQLSSQDPWWVNVRKPLVVDSPPALRICTQGSTLAVLSL